MDPHDNVIPFPGRSGRRPDEEPTGQALADDLLARVRSGEVSAGEVLAAFRQAMVFDFGGFDGDPGFGRVRPKLLRKRSTRVCYVVRLDLDNVRPRVWRRLRGRAQGVPARGRGRHPRL